MDAEPCSTGGQAHAKLRAGWMASQGIIRGAGNGAAQGAPAVGMGRRVNTQTLPWTQHVLQPNLQASLATRPPTLAAQPPTLAAWPPTLESRGRKRLCDRNPPQLGLIARCRPIMKTPASETESSFLGHRLCRVSQNHRWKLIT